MFLFVERFRGREGVAKEATRDFYSALNAVRLLFEAIKAISRRSDSVQKSSECFWARSVFKGQKSSSS
jgi:hypothetical protein